MSLVIYVCNSAGSLPGFVFTIEITTLTNVPGFPNILLEL